MVIRFFLRYEISRYLISRLSVKSHLIYPINHRLHRKNNAKWLRILIKRLRLFQHRVIQKKIQIRQIKTHQNSINLAIITRLKLLKTQQIRLRTLEILQTRLTQMVI
jgi:hypothetical protein